MKNYSDFLKTYNSFEPEGSQSLNGLKPTTYNLFDNLTRSQKSV